MFLYIVQIPDYSRFVGLLIGATTTTPISVSEFWLLDRELSCIVLLLSGKAHNLWTRDVDAG